MENEQEKIDLSSMVQEEVDITAKLSDSEVAMTKKILKNIDDGADKELFSNLPDPIKKMIVTQAKQLNITGKKELINFTKMTLEGIIADKEATELINEFNTEVNKLKNVPYLNVYVETVRDKCEIGFIKEAEQLEAIGDEKALELAKKKRQLSSDFKTTYEFNREYELLKDDKVVSKLRKIPNRFSRYDTDFGRIIKGINNFKVRLVNILKGLTHTGIKEEDAKKFLGVITMVMDKTPIEDEMSKLWMIYRINNLVVFTATNEERNEFTNTILDNINKLIEYINTREKELSERRTD